MTTADADALFALMDKKCDNVLDLSEWLGVLDRANAGAALNARGLGHSVPSAQDTGKAVADAVNELCAVISYNDLSNEVPCIPFGSAARCA